MPTLRFFTPSADVAETAESGFRFGNKGTHTSRTMMLSELSQVMVTVTPRSARTVYVSAVIEDNCLGKPTASTRRLTLQRLSELYALDPKIPLFRVFRSLWEHAEDSHALLALQCALARDPLLVATADAVLQLGINAEFLRDPMRHGIRAVVGERLNESTLDKVVRNAASSWTQSGHLSGRALKIRQQVTPTAATIAFGLYLGYQSGFRGNDLFSSGWIAVLDCSPTQAKNLALEAKRLGLIDIRMAADVIEIGFSRLENLKTRG